MDEFNVEIVALAAITATLKFEHDSLFINWIESCNWSSFWFLLYTLVANVGLWLSHSIPYLLVFLGLPVQIVV